MDCSPDMRVSRLERDCSRTVSQLVDLVKRLTTSPVVHVIHPLQLTLNSSESGGVVAVPAENLVPTLAKIALELGMSRAGEQQSINQEARMRG